jgi:hypothetical protein
MNYPVMESGRLSVAQPQTISGLLYGNIRNNKPCFSPPFSQFWETTIVEHWLLVPVYHYIIQPDCLASVTVYATRLLNISYD